jgi:hypothetical protein
MRQPTLATCDARRRTCPLPAPLGGPGALRSAALQTCFSAERPRRANQRRRCSGAKQPPGRGDRNRRKPAARSGRPPLLLCVSAVIRRDDLFEGAVGVKGDWCGRLCLVGCQGVLSSLSALGCADDRFQLSRLLKSLLGRQAARSSGSLPGQTSGGIGAWRLNGCWRERTCQLAIRILRAIAALAGLVFPWRCRVWV